MIQGSDYERAETQPRIIAPVTEASYSYISMVAHAATTMNPTCALILERFSIAFTANVRLKFPVYQKLVEFIWFQLIFYQLVTAMEQVLKTEK